MPTQSQIAANGPQNPTGPTSITSRAASSMNSLKSGTLAKIPPSPRKRPSDRHACVTKSPSMSATHSREIAYPPTRNTPGSQVLRHNAPVQPVTRPVAHSRNPLVGQLGKAARHPEGAPFTGATGGKPVPHRLPPSKLNHSPHQLASFRQLPLPPRHIPARHIPERSGRT
jgi:hypothetical protein